ncbi:MAG: NAD(P) transhydrogenase subunit alpha [Zetaproteobacteria bacterium]|nr:MAG: NAD(P) transhydrogenase subunit alpha [Zetaproteobacteria bacterium]
MAAHAGVDPFVFAITVFVLAVFVGYHVIWGVTPALHTPLMSLTNAISSIVIVGALLAAGPAELKLSTVLGLAAVFLTAINIVGGFAVTQRMLAMFKRRER